MTAPSSTTVDLPKSFLFFCPPPSCSITHKKSCLFLPRGCKTEVRGMSCQRNRIGHRGGACTNHATRQREARFCIARHQLPAVFQRERRRLAGRTQHVQAIAPVAEQIARNGPAAVGFTGAGRGGGDGRENATETLRHCLPFCERGSRAASGILHILAF